MSLILADQRQHCLYAIDAETLNIETIDSDTVLAEHAGFLQLPDHRIAYLDDAYGELVLLAKTEKGFTTSQRVAIAIPGEHLTVSPDGRWILVGTGFGAEFSATTDQITLVDLYPENLSRPRPYRVRTAPGEHGVGLSDNLAWVRHRLPGNIQTISLKEITEAGPHVPQVHGHFTHEIDDTGHGDAFDPLTQTFFVATARGLEQFVSSKNDQATPAGVIPWLPWGSEATARAFFLRIQPRQRIIVTTLRQGGECPTQWHTWKNWVWIHNIDTGKTLTAPAGEGLVFRCALTPTAVALTRIHPHGDELLVFNLYDLSLRGRWKLPRMSRAPKVGYEPWDNADRRAIAASPAEEKIAVSRGGHGEVHLFDVSRAGTLPRTLKVPSALSDGGHLGWFSFTLEADNMDTVGR